MRQQPESDVHSLDRHPRNAPDHHVDLLGTPSEPGRFDSVSGSPEGLTAERPLWRAPRRLVSALFDNDFFA